MMDIMGARFRRVEDRLYEGQPAMVVAAERRYETTVEDLWEAVTTKERLARWFLPVEGELELGGHFQLKGNASGTIERCEPPTRLNVTWTFGGQTSWVHLHLSAVDEGAKLVLEHIAPKTTEAEPFLNTYGPGATGVGWDLGLRGLGRYMADPDVRLDPAVEMAWATTDEGKEFIRACGLDWARAETDAGHSEAEALAKAERTIAFYTGAEH